MGVLSFIGHRLLSFILVVAGGFLFMVGVIMAVSSFMGYLIMLVSIIMIIAGVYYSRTKH
jgi:hypothetical protein